MLSDRYHFADNRLRYAFANLDDVHFPFNYLYIRLTSALRFPGEQRRWVLKQQTLVLSSRTKSLESILRSFLSRQISTPHTLRSSVICENENQYQVQIPVQIQNKRQRIITHPFVSILICFFGSLVIYVCALSGTNVSLRIFCKTLNLTR